MESEGAKIYFRNIRIMELPPGVTSPSNPRPRNAEPRLLHPFDQLPADFGELAERPLRGAERHEVVRRHAVRLVRPHELRHRGSRSIRRPAPAGRCAPPAEGPGRRRTPAKPGESTSAGRRPRFPSGDTRRAAPRPAAPRRIRAPSRSGTRAWSRPGLPAGCRPRSRPPDCRAPLRADNRRAGRS